MSSFLHPTNCDCYNKVPCGETSDPLPSCSWSQIQLTAEEQRQQAKNLRLDFLVYLYGQLLLKVTASSSAGTAIHGQSSSPWPIVGWWSAIETLCCSQFGACSSFCVDGSRPVRKKLHNVIISRWHSTLIVSETRILLRSQKNEQPQVSSTHLARSWSCLCVPAAC